jgi:type I restriction enzyme, S subunit
MVRLRDLGQWSGGNTPSKAREDYWTHGTVPWVSPKDMKTPEIASTEDRISEVAMNEGRAALLPSGAVLVVTRSGILSHTLPVATTRIPVTINQDIKALVPRKGVLPNYVAYALKGAGQRILKTCSKHGTTVASIETNPLLDFEIPLVDLDEQLRIVAEIDKQFSRLDEAVANLQRVKANLKRYKAAVLKAAVEGRLVETEASIARREGRGYEAGEQLRQRILEARRGQWSGRGKYKEPLAHDPCDLPNAPEGWAWCSVDEVSAETLIGLDRARDQQRTEALGVPYVKMNNVTMDGDVLTDELVCVDASDEERARFHLARGDLLFNTRNSVELVGKVGIVRTVPAGAVFNNNLMRLRTPDGVSSVFLGYQMCSLGFRQRMEKVKKATTRSGPANLNR